MASADLKFKVILSGHRPHNRWSLAGPCGRLGCRVPAWMHVTRRTF